MYKIRALILIYNHKKEKKEFHPHKLISKSHARSSVLFLKCQVYLDLAHNIAVITRIAIAHKTEARGSSGSPPKNVANLTLELNV